MNVFLTGSRGFVGRHLKKALIHSGYSIIESNTNNFNLLTYNDWYPIKDKIDYIIHLAAWTKAGDFCLHHQGEQWIINQQINTNILRFWRCHSDAKMIAIGTSCGYDSNIEIKSEENYLKGEPDKSLYTYGMTKRMLLVGLDAIYKQYGMNYTYFIPNTMYGPSFQLDDSHFIFDLIKKICDAKYTGSIPTLWGDGYQARELVYIDDVVNIIMSELNTESKLLNIAPGEEYTIREYAKMICDYVGYDFHKILFDTSAFVGAKSKKLVRTIDFPYTDIIKGLGITIDYYLNSRGYSHEV